MDIEEMIKKILNGMEEEMKNMKHANIIVVGKTGVGKSTLINSVFRENLATTGIGEPVTKSMKMFSKDGVPLRIYDTIGLELSEETQKQIKNDINNTIKECLDTKDPDKYIHCVWYCINVDSNRFEQVELDWINELATDNKYTGVPVIIVLTLSHNKKNTREMKTLIENKNLNVKNIIPVLAKNYEDDDFIREAYGGEDLIEFTFNILPETARKAFNNAQAASIGLKTRQAETIVAAASVASFGEGFIPLPFSDAIALVPTQLAMITSITAIYGVELNKAKLTAIMTSLLGCSGATIIGKSVVSNLLKLIPGVGTAVGGMISGVTASALTSALGGTYIKIMELIIKGEISTDDLENASTMDSIKNMFKDVLKNVKITL